MEGRVTQLARPQDESLESRYRSFFENEAIKDVVRARTPNNAAPVDEEAILRFVQSSDKGHAEYVRAVCADHPDLS